MEKVGDIENIIYEKGDIVVAKMLGTMITGQILKVHPSYYGCTNYNIQLLNNLTIELHHVSHKYYPFDHQDHEWYDVVEEKTIKSEPYTIGNKTYDGVEYQYTLVKLKVICIEDRKIHFSLQQRDINSFLQATHNGEKLKYLLRGSWKDLVFRKVKNVVLKSKLCVCKYTMDDRGNVSVDHSFRGNTIPQHQDQNNSLYEQSWGSYFGFTSKFGKNDREIYFSRENYNSIDMDIDITGWFGNFGNHSGGFTPPLQGQYVCGIVKEGYKGLYYDKWFTCSDQFFNFWSFIMQDTKTKSIDALVASVVKPNKWSQTKLVDEQLRKKKLEAVHKLLRCFDYYHDTFYDVLIRYIVLNEEPQLEYTIGKNTCRLINSVGGRRL